MAIHAEQAALGTLRVEERLVGLESLPVVDDLPDRLPLLHPLDVVKVEADLEPLPHLAPVGPYALPSLCPSNLSTTLFAEALDLSRRWQVGCRQLPAKPLVWDHAVGKMSTLLPSALRAVNCMPANAPAGAFTPGRSGDGHLVVGGRAVTAEGALRHSPRKATMCDAAYCGAFNNPWRVRLVLFVQPPSHRMLCTSPQTPCAGLGTYTDQVSTLCFFQSCFATSCRSALHRPSSFRNTKPVTT